MRKTHHYNISSTVKIDPAPIVTPGCNNQPPCVPMIGQSKASYLLS